MNSSLMAAGSPEQRTKPGSAPDLFSMKETPAKRGLKTHMPGVFRSAERSPFMSHTKADSGGLQELWSNNLNHRSIRQNLQALLWNVDKDNIVLEVLDNEQNLALRGLLDELLTNSWEGNWLTINQDLH